MNVKIKWLRDKLRILNMQGMIVSNPVNVKYLTNIDAEGILLITRKENIFITDGRYIEVANSSITIDDEIIVCNFKDLTKEDYENFFNFCENVGFEENYITYADYKEFIHRFQINNFEETEYMIEKQRMIKDEEEIECISKACKLTDDCFDHLREFIKIGMTEKEVEMEIEKFFKLNGADGNSFDSIVASGKNSSMPHAVPTDKKIEAGDIVTLDFGCKYKGYSSDMTRTIFVGFIPEHIKPVYNLVLKNQIQTTESLKEGANIRTISKLLENDFKLNGYELIHSLGHGVGLDIHEIPYINSRNDTNLKENMVITNEPGIYIPNKFGVRIEDTILITKYGAECLTKSRRDFIVVDGR